MGVNQIAITRITFSGDGADWLTLAEILPKTLSKEVGSMTGTGLVTIRLTAPANAKPGDYTVPVRVEAEAVGNRFETSSSLTFRIVEPTVPAGGVSDIMTYIFAGIILIALAYAYLKGSENCVRSEARKVNHPIVTGFHDPQYSGSSLGSAILYSLSCSSTGGMK